MLCVYCGAVLQVGPGVPDCSDAVCLLWRGAAGRAWRARLLCCCVSTVARCCRSGLACQIALLLCVYCGAVLQVGPGVPDCSDAVCLLWRGAAGRAWRARLLCCCVSTVARCCRSGLACQIALLLCVLWHGAAGRAWRARLLCCCVSTVARCCRSGLACQIALMLCVYCGTVLQVGPGVPDCSDAVCTVARCCRSGLACQIALLLCVLWHGAAGRAWRARLLCCCVSTVARCCRSGLACQIALLLGVYCGAVLQVGPGVPDCSAAVCLLWHGAAGRAWRARLLCCCVSTVARCCRSGLACQIALMLCVYCGAVLQVGPGVPDCSGCHNNRLRRGERQTRDRHQALRQSREGKYNIAVMISTADSNVRMEHKEL